MVVQMTVAPAQLNNIPMRVQQSITEFVLTIENQAP
jgi:hypothetical protein